MNEINAHPLLDLAVLDRYLADEAVPAERAQVEAWLAANPLHVQRLQVLQTLGESADIIHAEPLNVDRAWTQVAREQESFVRGRIRSVTTDRNGSKSQGNQIRWRGVFQAQPLRQRMWSPLTWLIMGTTLIVAAWQLGGIRLINPLATPHPLYTTYATANGERATITLPDSNTVTLDVASRLEVPSDYSTGNHVVRLPVGEALFTVSHHTDTPFTVVTGATTTRVLGTTFVVRHFSTDSAVTVAVEEGKVAVGPTVVMAQQMATMSQAGGTDIGLTNPGQFSFATGVLTLDNMRLSSAIPDLDRWYDADIRLGDAMLATKLVKGKLPAGSLADLAGLLAWTLDVRVVRDGRVLTLFPRSI